jgi:flagellar biosynthesis protein FliR
MEKNHLNIARKSLILCNLICLFLLFLSVDPLNTWLIAITAGSFVILAVGLFITESDPATIFVLILLSTFLSGLILGISIAYVVKN